LLCNAPLDLVKSFVVFIVLGGRVFLGVAIILGALLLVLLLLVVKLTDLVLRPLVCIREASLGLITRGF